MNHGAYTLALETPPDFNQERNDAITDLPLTSLTSMLRISDSYRRTMTRPLIVTSK
jgi:hypothetical protein